jgi:hypothetical protein
MIIPFSFPFRIAKLVSKQALRIQIITTLRLIDMEEQIIKLENLSKLK